MTGKKDVRHEWNQAQPVEKGNTGNEVQIVQLEENQAGTDRWKQVTNDSGGETEKE